MDKIQIINAYPSAEPIDLGVLVDTHPPVYEPVDIVFVPNTLVGCYGHITKHFKNIEMVAYPQHRGSIGLKGILSNYLLKRKIKIDRPAVSIFSGWSDGYYHFTLESLVKLFILKDHIDGATIVLPAKPQKFHLEWLNILGYKDITFVKLKELVRTPLAISCNFPASDGNHHNTILPEFREWVLGKVKNRPTVDSRKLFVGRRLGSQRNLINQKEMASALEKKGFAFILMEDFSLADQIDMFRNAEVIVAVHGAALANLAFSPPNTKVVDLIHEKYDQQCFLKLSRILNLDYCRLPCRGEATTEEDARLKDYRVEIDKVFDLLKR